MLRATLLVAVATILAVPAEAQNARRDQDEAYDAVRRGAIRPMDDVIARVQPQVDGKYFSGDLNPGSRTYRLKFMRERGAVIEVDVDARTGNIISTRGK